MLKSVYVIDIVVRDLDRAIPFFRTILGTDPIDTSEIGADQGEVRAAHFPAPGPGKEGVHSIGLFQLTTDAPKTLTGKRIKKFLDEHGEGVCLIGFQVDDIDKTQRSFEEQGLQFIKPVPDDYQMGRGNELERYFGVGLWFAQHDNDGYEKFLALASQGADAASGKK